MPRFRLSFENRELEHLFQTQYQQAYRPVMLLGVVVGVVLFSLFGILDRLLFPDRVAVLWTWRYGFCLPPLLVTAAVLLWGPAARWIQPMLAAAAAWAGWGSLGMIHALPPTGCGLYYAGIMLVIFYAHAFVRLQFLWATLATLAILAGYEVLIWGVGTPDSFPEIVAQHFFLLAAALGGMGASYAMELDARQQFMLRHRLGQERQQLQEANRRLEALNRQLDQMAHLDELTGLANRRCFVEELERAHREQQREGAQAGPIALLLIDIDHFKHFNDRYGHPEGDRCLARVAAILARFARRPRDLAARIGGEEFVLMLPDTPAEAALSLAEALHRAVAEADILPGVGPVTVSIGVAVLAEEECTPPDRLLVRADQALYRSKRRGRNRVSLWGPEAAPVAEAAGSSGRVEG